jgi:hypothetical protein
MQIRSKSQSLLHNNATKKTWDLTDLAASSARAKGTLLPALPIPAKHAVLESKYKLNILAKPGR